MSDDLELLAAINAEMGSAAGVDTSKLSEQRSKAMEYYYGEPYGNEQPDRSNVVTREVMDTVEWIKPELMKLFASGTETVRFEPQNTNDVEAAQQATDYVNYLFHRKNRGFKILYDWITDGLLQKTGVVKVWWDDSSSRVREEYRGLSQLELMSLARRDDVELIEQNSYDDPTALEQYQAQMEQMQQQMQQMQTQVPQQMVQAQQQIAQLPPEQQQQALQQMAQMQQQVQQQMMQMQQQMQQKPQLPQLYDVAVIRTGPGNGLKVQVLPPEEFKISSKARCIDSSSFCAHERDITISDLRAMGYEDLDDLPSASPSPWLSDEKRARHSVDDTDDTLYGRNGNDPAMREVTVCESYIRYDYDGDGLAEIRKVIHVGDRILENTEVDCMPFASWSPIMISHKFHGLSVADLVMDLQRIQSQLFRNLLDNQYLTNNGRYVAVENMVNLDDLMTSRPHGVVRVKMQGAVARLDTPQLSQSAFQMLAYVDQLRERRTGVSERTQGLDPNQLGANTAATAVNQVMTAAQQRIELIARVFGETGLTDLFLLMYKFVIQNQTSKDIFKLRDKYIEVDPSEWRERKDTSVVVGLGNGSREQEMLQLNMIFQNQMALSQNPAFATLVSPDNLYNTLEDQVKVFNKAASGRHFTDPASPEAQQRAQQQAQQQQAMQQAQQQMQQALMQIEQQKNQIKELEVQVKQGKAQGELQLKAEEVKIKRDAQTLDEQEHEDDVALRTAELALEAEQERGVKIG
jgi:flagellar biosynthesis GTPase FlhF